MPAKRLRYLLIGLAMTFLGPALGSSAYLAMAIQATSIGPASGSLPEALAQLQELPSQMFLAMIPFLLGSLCGAAGVVVVISNLISHFLRPQPTLSPASGASFSPAA